MNVIFSRDRPAQLDLLLRSLRKFNPFHQEMNTVVIYRASAGEFRQGYERLSTVALMREEEDFDTDLRWALGLDADTVTFWCDDDILIRPVPTDPARMLLDNDRLLCVRLTLGRQNRPTPNGFPVWKWQELPPTDFGYPCGLDGLVMRVTDANDMLQEHVANPNIMETILAMGAERLHKTRPLAACFMNQVAVGVPVNRVSRISTIPVGQEHPQTTRQLNRMWLKGYRISLDGLDASGVRGVHHEMKFQWERA